MQVIKNIQPSS